MSALQNYLFEKGSEKWCFMMMVDADDESHDEESLYEVSGELLDQKIAKAKLDELEEVEEVEDYEEVEGKFRISCT